MAPAVYELKILYEKTSYDILTVWPTEIWQRMSCVVIIHRDGILQYYAQSASGI